LNFGDGPDLIWDFQSGADKIAFCDGFSAPVFFNGAFHGSFGTDGQLRSGTDVSQVQYSNPSYGALDELYCDTDDGQLYQLTYDHANYAVDAELLATFANGAQLTTSDFIFV
jgi:hypothetical protein